MATSKYPALPKEVNAPGGTIAVVRKTPLTDKGVELWGSWEEHLRVITVDSTCTPRHAWKVYYHELFHACLDDSGLSNGLTDEMQEALCDSAAIARMRERFG